MIPNTLLLIMIDIDPSSLILYVTLPTKGCEEAKAVEAFLLSRTVGENDCFVGTYYLYCLLY